MNKKFYLLISLLISLPLFSQSEISIYFEFDSYTINPASKLEIHKLNQDSESVSIVGYTDQAGSTTYNERLSQQRAEAIKQFLIASGVESTRIKSVIGKGKHPDSSLSSHKQRSVLITVESEKTIEKEVKTDELISTELFSNLKIGETLAIPF